MVSRLEILDQERLNDMRVTGDDKNKRRVIRAIEIGTVLGKVPKFNDYPKNEGRRADAAIRSAAETTNHARAHPPLIGNYNQLFIGLNVPAEELKRHIRDRLIKRIGAGMIEEAERLHQAPPVGCNLSWERMEELGLEYRYLARFLQGKTTREEMIEKLCTEIWRYAKRQMTWFRRDERIRWFETEARPQFRHALF